MWKKVDWSVELDYNDKWFKIDNLSLRNYVIFIFDCDFKMLYNFWKIVLNVFKIKL